MKILKNSTYQDLLNANSVLYSANANLKSNLDIVSDKAVRLERKLIKVEKDSEILTEGIIRIEQEKSGIREMYANELLKREHVISDLEKERLYVNLTRDKKGVLHSINPIGKVRKRKLTVPIPTPAPVENQKAIPAKDFAVQNNGRIATVNGVKCKVCGYDNRDIIVGVGVESLDGWTVLLSGDVILTKHNKYLYADINKIKLS